ncbi:MAG: M48 family metalloprotease [Candidatus Odyssella sp.]|nr:M48 family metalloprotease [Candidatus Odyssella sp.]
MSETAARPKRLAATARHRVASAIWWNWINSMALCAALTLVGGALAYVVGWAIDVYLSNDMAPSGKAPGLFLVSNWGFAAALLTAVVGAALAIRALVVGDVVMARILGAREVSESEEPKLHEAARRVADAAGIPKPRLVVIEGPAMNAFAAGRDEFHATVGVTRGLLDALEPHELEGVLGHEIGHICNHDIVYADIVALCLGLIVILREIAGATARIGAEAKSSRSSRSGDKKDGGGAAIVAIAVLVVTAVLAPLLAQLVQMAISRQREYGADAAGAYLAGSPDGLASALAKIEKCKEKLAVNRAVQHVFIVNPLKRFKEDAGALMSTHPATSLRVARLKELRD